MYINSLAEIYRGEFFYLKNRKPDSFDKLISNAEAKYIFFYVSSRLVFESFVISLIFLKSAPQTIVCYE